MNPTLRLLFYRLTIWSGSLVAISTMWMVMAFYLDWPIMEPILSLGANSAVLSWSSRVLDKIVQADYVGHKLKWKRFRLR